MMNGRKARGIRTAGLCLLLSASLPCLAQWESPGRIAAAATAYISARHPWRDMDNEVIVDRIDPRSKLAKCPTSLEAFLPPGAKIKRRTTVGVRCNSGKPWKIYLPVTVAAYAKVMVSKHAIAPGTALTAADVSWTRRDISSLGYGYLRSLDGAGGYRSRYTIAQGAVITPNMVEADNVIHKGQQVHLLTQVGSIRVSMNGIALENGALGTRIKVKNMSSGKALEGVVESDHSVMLN